MNVLIDFVHDRGGKSNAIHTKINIQIIAHSRRLIRWDVLVDSKAESSPRIKAAINRVRSNLRCLHIHTRQYHAFSYIHRYIQMSIQLPVEEELYEIEAQLSLFLFEGEARLHDEILRIIISLREIKDVHTKALLDIILGRNAKAGYVLSLILGRP